MPISDAELSELYMRYAPILHARARGILGDHAEADDAVQEIFARVIRAGDRFRDESSPLTWMYQIGTHWCLNRIRDRKGHDKKHVDRRFEIVGQEAFEADSDLHLDDTALRSLLEEEEEDTQRMVIALFFDDMTREEAAKVLGISVPTLRKRLDLFLRRARRVLGVGVPAALTILAAWFLLGGQP